MRWIRLFFAPLTLLSTLLAALPIAAAWHALPAGTPSVTSIVSDSYGNRLWLSAAAGGLWFSSDAGLSWTAASSRFRTVHDTKPWVDRFKALDSGADTIIAVSPSNGYTSSSHYSFDGGQTWQSFADTTVEYWAEVEIWNRRHNVWFSSGTYGRIHRSDDLGRSWTTIYDSTYGTGAWLHQDVLHDSTIYSVFTGGSDLLSFGVLGRSDDLGRTWRDLMGEDTLPGTPVDIVRLANGNLLVPFAPLSYAPYLDASILRRSTDDGTTWQDVPGFPADCVVKGLVADGASPENLFAAGFCPGGILRSTDNGATWLPHGAGLPSNDVRASLLYRNLFSGMLYVLVDNYGLFRSTDRGDTWHEVTLPPIGYPWGRFTNSQQSVFFNGGSICQMRSPSTQWRTLAGEQVTADTIISLYSAIYQHDDFIIAWAQVTPRHDPYGYEHQVECFAQSDDNGATWQLRPPLSFISSDWDIYVHETPLETRFVAMSSYDSVIHVSTDLGQTWRSSALFPFDWNLALVQNDSAIYVEQMNNIERSVDGGLTWTGLGDYGDLSTGIVLLGDELFLPSLNTGVRRLAHWRSGVWDLRGSLPERTGYMPFPAMVAVDGPTPVLALMMQDSSTLWTSTDSGYTWVRNNYELPFAEQNYAISNIAADTPRQRIWASTRLGTCYIPISEVLAAKGTLHFKPADYTVLSAYPNPFNSTTRIRFDLEKEERVSVDVFDLQGRLVTSLVNGVQESGRHEIAFDGSALASGTYFVRLHSTTVTRTEKLLLLK